MKALQLGMSFLACFILSPSCRAQIPVFKITPEGSSINFHVKASVKIAGKFDKWNAVLRFASPEETAGVLEITIQAASVDTGSGMKNGKLKGKDFFDVERNPVITFKSTRFVPTAPYTFEVDGDFTIRGVANPEKLRLVLSHKGTESDIKGSMVFNRKDYGMKKGIPFIKIADHVDVNFHLKGKRVSSDQAPASAVAQSVLGPRTTRAFPVASLCYLRKCVMSDHLSGCFVL